MKDPQDCTYPQEALCLHDCKQACQKRSGWRKKQIDDAEEEAWKELEKASAMREVQRLGQEIEPVADYIAARDMLDAQPVPQRTWVGLTDEDMCVVSEEESCSFIAGAKWSEEILKGKNT